MFFYSLLGATSTRWIELQEFKSESIVLIIFARLSTFIISHAPCI